MNTESNRNWYGCFLCSVLADHFISSVCVFLQLCLCACSGEDKNVHEQSKRDHREEESCSSR